MALVSLIFALLVSVGFASSIRYEPNWDSLDRRPLPAWYDEAKLGICLHWGVFSVPSFRNEWFWDEWKGSDPFACVVNFMKNNYPPDFTYPDFAAELKAELFNPDDWADIIQASGAKYVVMTSKHHEGFTMWPSKHSWPWNAQNLGARRDLVGDLANSIRSKTNVRFGLYHSLFEWFNPLYLQDAANGYKTQDFVATKTMPELYELVNIYKPDIIWSDGDWMVNDTYWNSTNFLAWLYNDSPVKDTVCVNDRWGQNARCKHGGFLNCDDAYDPDVLQPRKWEDAMSMDTISWGFRRNAAVSDYRTVKQLIHRLAKTVSLGGNLMINVGPTAYGVIPQIFEERLRQIGEWMNLNGDAIYNTHPWIYQRDTVTPHLWYTSRNYTSGEVVYAISLRWPAGSTLILGGAEPGPKTKVQLIGFPQPLSFARHQGGGMAIKVPHVPYEVLAIPGEAWVFRLDFLQNRRK